MKYARCPAVKVSVNACIPPVGAFIQTGLLD